MIVLLNTFLLTVGKFVEISTEPQQAWVAIAAAVIGAITSGVKMAIGAKQKREAINRIDNIQRQELKNAYAGLDAYSPEARAFAQRNIQSNMGTTAAAMKESGGRYGQVLASTQENTNKAIMGQAAVEQEAQVDLNKLKAGDEQNIRRITEDRSILEEKAYAKLYAAGDQNMMSGMTELGSNIGAGLAGAEADGYIGGGDGSGGEKSAARTKAKDAKAWKKANGYASSGYGDWVNNNNIG